MLISGTRGAGPGGAAGSGVSASLVAVATGGAPRELPVLGWALGWFRAGGSGLAERGALRTWRPTPAGGGGEPGGERGTPRERWHSKPGPAGSTEKPNFSL